MQKPKKFVLLNVSRRMNISMIYLLVFLNMYEHMNILFLYLIIRGIILCQIQCLSFRKLELQPYKKRCELFKLFFFYLSSEYFIDKARGHSWLSPPDFEKHVKCIHSPRIINFFSRTFKLSFVLIALLKSKSEILKRREI